MPQAGSTARAASSCAREVASSAAVLRRSKYAAQSMLSHTMPPAPVTAGRPPPPPQCRHTCSDMAEDSVCKAQRSNDDKHNISTFSGDLDHFSCLPDMCQRCIFKAHRGTVSFFLGSFSPSQTESPNLQHPRCCVFLHPPHLHQLGVGGVEGACAGVQHRDRQLRLLQAGGAQRLHRPRQRVAYLRPADCARFSSYYSSDSDV